MQIQWSRDRPNVLIVDDDQGRTEVTSLERAAAGKADAARRAHAAALRGQKADREVKVERVGKRGTPPGKEKER